MKKKQTLIIISIFILVLLAGMIITVFLLQRPQTTVPRATETGPMCPANGATCSWDSDATATSFKVEIVDETTGSTLLTTTTSNKAVQFTPIANHQYKCNVTPVNTCGEGPVGSATNTCVPMSSPTPTPSEVPSVTPTPTVVMCQQPSSCKTSDQCTTDGGTPNDEHCSDAGTICCVPPSVTPTATPTVTNTPTPTNSPTPTATSTPIPTFTPVPTNTPYPTYTPYPTNTPLPTSTPRPTNTGTPVPTWTPVPTYTPQPTYTPIPTSTGVPTATPTEIIIVVNNTNTPTPTTEGTSVPTIPAAGVPVAWYLVLIPVALLGLGLIF